MSYSIVVVTWQSADHLAGLVHSMNKHLEDTPELVIVDNASTDDPRTAAREWRGDVVFVSMPENTGFGVANNEGVARARSDAVVLLNPDTRLVDRTLSDLARAALDLGALVGPRVVNSDGTIQPSASGAPVGIWPWVNALWPGRLMPAAVQRRTEPWRLNRRTQVDWLTGAALAAPTGILRGLGPFDPTIHLYSEDLDLGLRAQAAGVPIYFCPDVATVLHIGDASSSQRFPDSGLGLAAANRRAVLTKAFGRRSERRARRASRVNLHVRALTKGLSGRSASREKAHLSALSSLDEQ